MSQAANQFTDAANNLAADKNADVLIFNAKVDPPYDQALGKMCRTRKRRANCAVFLCTYGGDADAGYRIARCLQRSYEKVTVYVCGDCKSAGTLIAIAAHELVMTDTGELGPLDVQLGKKDELWETDSGLTVLAAIETLEEKAFSLFESAFIQLKSRSGGRITLKTATALAAELSIGVIRPIVQQIDPLHVGSVSRAMTIGSEYGSRLASKSKNVKDGTIGKLTHGYPSHGFVIDRDEAKALFVNVRSPDSDAERAMVEILDEQARDPSRTPLVGYLSDELKDADNDEANQPGDAGTGATPNQGADGGDSNVTHLQRGTAS